jgi:hypothetical protein
VSEGERRPDADRTAGGTARKPPGMRPADWVDRQIREAQERGAFDDLPGAGKPIPNLDRPFTAAQWAADWARRQGGDLTALLPPMLALRKERAALLADLAQVPSEAVLRELIADFNHRLLDQYRRPMDGPLMAVGVLEPDEVVAAWREQRPPPAEPPPLSPPPRRRRFRFRSRFRI